MSFNRKAKGIDPVEEASLESFPASDPPGGIPIHVGAPSRKSKPTSSPTSKTAAGDSDRKAAAGGDPTGSDR